MRGVRSILFKLSTLPILTRFHSVMSSNGYLNAIAAMELSQCCVQALWNDASPLKQIPFFTDEIIERCSANEVGSVYDVTELEDTTRNELLQLSLDKLRKVAQFVNAYPNSKFSISMIGAS
jgi:pre-mRNA-splicing helicase BRR2